jgi:hypothetical protein
VTSWIEDAEDENTCARCRACFALDEGCDPTRYCHPCAQDVAQHIVELVEERASYIGTHNHDDVKFVAAVIAAVYL